MLKTYLITLILLVCFSGCAKCEPVKIPVKCKVPEVHCHVSGNNVEKIGGLLSCIYEQREAMKVCQ